MRRAGEMRPVPDDIRYEIKKQRDVFLKEHGQRPLPPDRERVLRKALKRIHSASERALDLAHPVGAAAAAIREALAGFRPWQIDLSQVDFSKVAWRMGENRSKALSYLFPGDFYEASPGAYVSGERALLVVDEDGAVCRVSEIIRRKATRKAFTEQIQTGAGISDILSLLWKQAESIDLASIEAMLRRLCEAVVPGLPIRFTAYEEPHYRNAVRMQLGDFAIPAAIGGVLRPWSELPKSFHAASIAIYLEPWASARSGQIIGLAEYASPFAQDDS
jgi:hypothetical protein